MGNCCPKSSEEQVVLTQGGNRVQAFQGQVRRTTSSVAAAETTDCFCMHWFSRDFITQKGHRLGTGDEAKYRDDATGTKKKVDDDLPAAAVDPNLTPAERSQIRADRAAAAEARLKKQGGTQPKKKKPPSDAPLVGPNSKPTMQWTL